jgi:hypothetical protein
MRGLNLLRSSRLRARIFPSLNKIWPEVGSINLRIAFPAVVLPQPLSPTNPSVSPLRMEKVMPSTARIGSLSEEKSFSL